MPNPHFDVQVISRSTGQSVVAAAAYRSGEVLYDGRVGKTFDYSRKEDVLHTEIMAPIGAPAWVSDRAALWNKVEASEKRKDAQLARSIIAALPRELDKEQNLALLRGYIQETFVTKGMIADLALHESDAGDGSKNPHAHILLTLRPLEDEGFGKKNRDWNRVQTLNGWRHAWEVHTNQYLELAGRTERVSLKSFKEQGINKHPQVHLGEDAGNLEKRGIETRRGNHNRKVQHENALIEILTPDFAVEPEENIGEDLDHGNSQRENGQMQPTTTFLNTDPTMRLEAMTLELKDEKEEFSDSKSGADGKAATMGAFKQEDNDPAKLAVSSLEASRAVHEAALREYVEDPAYQRVNAQVVRQVGLKEYARYSAERIKDISQKVYQQLGNLFKETDRLREREKEGYER